MMLSFALALCLQQEIDEKVKVLLERLQDDDVSVREQAETDLLALGEAALPAMQKARKGADPETAGRLDLVIDELTLPQRWTADLQKERYGGAALQRLQQEILQKKLPMKQVLRILRESILSPDSTDDLRQRRFGLIESQTLAADGDASVRREAALALGTLQAADHAARLEEILRNDPEIPVRRAALQAIARIRGTAATGLVTEHLSAEHADLRATAVELLPSMDSTAVLDEITKGDQLTKPFLRYALAAMIASGGEAMLHRVMARVGDRVSADDLNALVRLIQAARGR